MSSRYLPKGTFLATEIFRVDRSIKENIVHEIENRHGIVVLLYCVLLLSQCSVDVKVYVQFSFACNSEQMLF
jgi:hypothetical protein